MTRHNASRSFRHRRESMPAVNAHCVGVVLITQHAVACASLLIFICQKARANPRCPHPPRTRSLSMPPDGDRVNPFGTQGNSPKTPNGCRSRDHAFGRPGSLSPKRPEGPVLEAPFDLSNGRAFAQAPTLSCNTSAKRLLELRKGCHPPRA